MSQNLQQTISSDTEYIILENIYDSEGQQVLLKQRDMAQIAGASLGMTNSILKRLAQKGWITIRKLNSRNIQYAITLEGINEIIHRSYRYFKKTIKNVVYFKDILDDVIGKAANRNINTVLLVGTSDLDFIVEHACVRWNLNFQKINNDKNIASVLPRNCFKIYAEGIPSGNKTDSEDFAPPDVFYLSSFIIKQAAAASLNEDRI